MIAEEVMDFEEEGPQIPGAFGDDDDEVAIEDDDEEFAEDDAVGADEEYAAILDSVAGERRAILERYARLPDYVDNEEMDILASNVWQFEKNAGDHCDVFYFAGDALERSENLREECPPFF